MILINGTIQDSISTADRGLQYGDGLFETLPVINGRPLCLDRHIRRLSDSCHRLDIPLPDHKLLHDEIMQLSMDQSRAVIKLVVTRGQGKRGYRADTSSEPLRILSRHPWPDYPATWYTEGINVIVCKTPVSENPLLAGMKHLNRLDSVLARNEWQDSHIAEGLMLDSHGHVIQGTMSNIFVVKDSRLLTPSLQRAGIDGIIRKCVIEEAGQLGLSVDIMALSLDAVAAADEVFLCNSVAGIWPVRQLGEQVLPAARPVTDEIRRFLVNQEMIPYHAEHAE